MMTVLVTGVSTIENFLQLVGLIIIFAIILAAAYFTTRFVGTSGVSGNKTKNIKVIETYKLGPGKFLQIVEIGGKYIVIAIGKDSIEYITEIEEDQIIKSDAVLAPLSFKDVLASIKNKANKNL